MWGRGCDSSSAHHVDKWYLLHAPAVSFVTACIVGSSSLQRLDCGGGEHLDLFFSLRDFIFNSICPIAVSGMF